MITVLIQWVKTDGPKYVFYSPHGLKDRFANTPSENTVAFLKAGIQHNLPPIQSFYRLECVHIYAHVYTLS